MRTSLSLLPRAFESVQSERKFTILDLGSPTPESVRFFNRFRCSIYFADVLGHGDDDPDSELPGFDFPSDLRFDICLFWDVLNYLDVATLHDMVLRLDRHVDGNTRGHGFLAFSRAVSFSGSRFGIEEFDRVVEEPDPQPVPHIHTWRDIEDAVWPWVRRTTSLMQGNRQEVLLTKELT